MIERTRMFSDTPGMPGRSVHAPRMMRSIDTPARDRALTRFTADWEWRGEPVTLLSRATDSTGYVQPTREALVAARGMNSYYHYNGIQSWRIGADGNVRNA